MTTQAPLRTEILTRLDQLERIAPELDALVARADPAFYHEIDFFIPWCRTATARGQHLHLVTVRSAQHRLTGFAPLCRRRDVKALLAQRLAPPRIGSSPPFDILLDPDEDQAALIDAIAAQLAKRGWTDLRIPQTPARSNFAALLVPALTERGMAAERTEEPGFYKIEGFSSSEEYIGHFKSKKRVELNRLYNRFMNGARLVIVEDAADLDTTMGWLKQVLAHSWKNQSYLHDTFLPLLRTQLALSLPLGRSKLSFAFKKDMPVGFLVEFIDRNGTRNAYYNAHDPSENALSPGASLLQFSARAALDDGAPAYLFWGNRDYLKRLSEQTEAICTVEIRRPGPYSQLSGAAAGLAARLRTPRSRRA